MVPSGCTGSGPSLCPSCATLVALPARPSLEAPSRLGRPPSRPARPSPACIADDLSSILNEPGSYPVQPWQLVVPEPQAFPLLLQESRVRPKFRDPFMQEAGGDVKEPVGESTLLTLPIVGPCPCTSGSCSCLGTRPIDEPSFLSVLECSYTTC